MTVSNVRKHYSWKIDDTNLLASLSYDFIFITKDNSADKPKHVIAIQKSLRDRIMIFFEIKYFFGV